MKFLAVLSTVLLGLAVSLTPAVARDQYVVDNAHLFSAGTVQAANQNIAAFQSRTGKEVFVYTTPSLGGASWQDAAERVFAQNQVNGVMVFISTTPKAIHVIPDRASRSFFPATSTTAIANSIAANFRAGNFDGGLQNGVLLIENMYLSHLPAGRSAYGAPIAAPHAPVSNSAGGFSMGWIFLVLIVIVGLLVLRAIFRAIFAPRVTGPYGPSGGMGGPAYGPGPGYGGPGYGPGYGYGSGFGGGGSFWSGLLGGLGGAWLGNEMFGQHNIGGNVGGLIPGGEQGTPGAGQDTSGFQSDPGQVDIGNAGSGDWGGGAGGGDFGGGDFGGGDMGGGSAGW